MKIVIAGTGNIAFHFGRAFIKSGHQITGVFSRDLQKAVELSEAFSTVAIAPEDLHPSMADLVFIAVSDDAISNVSANFPSGIRQVHTSGTVDIDALSTIEKGVFYPVQTFSKNREVEIRKVPVCIEASTQQMQQMISELAHSITDHVVLMDSIKRKWLHLSAVFANNFTNQFYHIASKIVKEHNLSFDLLKPLITETSDKILTLAPFDVQTGPARRGNQKVMKEHLSMLAKNPELQELYKMISAQIRRTHSEM